MRAFKAKAKLPGSHSDSDESFHCAGRPGDLALDSPPVDGGLQSPVQEVFVPDNPDYYLYESGLSRVNGLASPINLTLPVRGPLKRSLTGNSLDTQLTQVESPILVIKTAGIVASPSSNKSPVVSPSYTVGPRSVRFPSMGSVTQAPHGLALARRAAISSRPKLPSMVPSPPPLNRSLRRRGMIIESHLFKPPPSPPAQGSSTSQAVRSNLDKLLTDLEEILAEDSDDVGT